MRLRVSCEPDIRWPNRPPDRDFRHHGPRTCRQESWRRDVYPTQAGPRTRWGEQRVTVQTSRCAGRSRTPERSALQSRWFMPSPRHRGCGNRCTGTSRTQTCSSHATSRNNWSPGSSTRPARLILDVVVDCDVMEGSPSRVLLQEASSATELVVGSRHLTALRSAVLGSVGVAAAGRTACPMIVVRGPAGQPEERRSGRRRRRGNGQSANRPSLGISRRRF